MRESASTDLREPWGSNPLGPPGPELEVLSPELLRGPGTSCLWRSARLLALIDFDSRG